MHEAERAANIGVNLGYEGGFSLYFSFLFYYPSSGGGIVWRRRFFGILSVSLAIGEQRWREVGQLLPEWAIERVYSARARVEGNVLLY